MKSALLVRLLLSGIVRTSLMSKPFFFPNGTQFTTANSIRICDFDWCWLLLVTRAMNLADCPEIFATVIPKLGGTHRLQMVVFLVYRSCVTISNRDSLSSSESGVNPGIRSWEKLWLSSMSESHW
jgi:hypothetical protein